MRIDSHHHCWNYQADEYPWIGDDMSVLKRSFLPAHLAQDLERTGIEGVVSVQARQSVAETEWLIQLADQHSFLRGVVGWVPLMSEDLEAVLEAVCQSPKLRAVRHVVQDEPDNQFILGQDFNRGIRLLLRFALVYDVLIYPRQLPAAIEFVDRHPSQPFVLDHIAKPRIFRHEFDREWEANFREIARRPHVVCKFSAVVTEVRDPEWDLDVIRPYWEVALDAFGPERLMFGSDWPLCLLRTSYGGWVDAVGELASSLTSTERDSIFGETAVKAYGLSSAADDA